jgi:hypothetical protein
MNQGSLGVITEDGMFLLSETVMQSAMSGELTVIQTAVDEVALHLTGSSTDSPWMQNAGMYVNMCIHAFNT